VQSRVEIKVGERGRRNVCRHSVCG
jgi:hypothetical protein